MQGFLYIVLAIVVFLFIITVHEFGHFITAKLFKVKVPEFSIGFGPVIFKKKKGDTSYSLRLLPIGGYVQMVGEDEASDDENALCNKPTWQRIIITGAGAFLNVLMGFIVYVVIMWNVTQMPTLKVSQTVENTPAYNVLEVGDEIVAANGNRVWYYKDFKFLLNTISPGEELSLTVKRNGETFNVDITPNYTEEKEYQIGILMDVEEIGFFGKLKYAFYELFFIIKAIFYSLFLLISGKVAFNNVSGPVGTVGVMVEAARGGFMSFLSLFGMLTVNIGIFNLLPFPALDGGRVFFMIIELIRGKKIPPEKEGLVHFIGLLILFLLMIFVTVNDVMVLFRD